MIKIAKKSDTAIVPERNKNSAGLDLFVNKLTRIEPHNGKEKDVMADKDGYILRPDFVYKAYSGISVELPEKTFGLVKARSGVSVQHGLDVLAGVIDNDYRGEIITVFKIMSNMRIKVGDRISQLIILPFVDAAVNQEKKENLTKTDRGFKGFGSSGK